VKEGRGGFGGGSKVSREQMATAGGARQVKKKKTRDAEKNRNVQGKGGIFGQARQGLSKRDTGWFQKKGVRDWERVATAPIW